MGDTQEETRWRYAFRDLLKEAPKDYERQYLQFAAMREVFLQELCVSLARSLSEFLRTQHPETAAEKLALAEQVNRQLSKVGLAILAHHASRSHPAKLIVDKDDPSGRGYFRLQVEDVEGNAVTVGSKTRGVPSDLFEHLELVPTHWKVDSPLPARGRKRPGPRSR